MGYHAINKIDPKNRGTTAGHQRLASRPATSQVPGRITAGCAIWRGRTPGWSASPPPCARVPAWWILPSASRSATTTWPLPNSTPSPFAAGMACDGLKPVVAIYSTFLQRGYDQLIHDVALQNLDVTFAIDRAGLVGRTARLTTAPFDLSYLRCIPNIW